MTRALAIAVVVATLVSTPGAISPTNAQNYHSPGVQDETGQPEANTSGSESKKAANQPKGSHKAGKPAKSTPKAGAPGSVEQNGQSSGQE